MEQLSFNRNKIIYFFALVWFVVNCIQAWGMGIDGDEAYYWVLSQKLDWGYFDHPPMVALLIRIGEAFGHGTLFTRFGTIILMSLSVLVIYYSLPESLKKPKLYLLIFSATLILNVYGFIATPDAPLFFFASCFFYAYKKYLDEENAFSVLLLVLSITGMLYSKYHAVLPVFFTLLSNIKLLRKKSFWIIVLLSAILFIPHIIWQGRHDWATIRFHLLERTATPYEIQFTTDYLLGQLLVWGPFIGLFFFINAYKIKIENKYIKAHVFNFFGVLLFFLASSFKNSVEPHWTLVAGSSFITLFLVILSSSEKLTRYFTITAIINLIIIITARIFFLLPHSPFEKIENFRPFFEAKSWADELNTTTGGKPVIFKDSYSLPALYDYYYPGMLTIGYNTKAYRKTNYTITAIDHQLDGKQAWIFSQDSLSEGSINFHSTFRDGKLLLLPAFTSINSLKIKLLDNPTVSSAGGKFNAILEIKNEGNYPVINRNHLKIDYSFLIKKYDFINSLNSIEIPDSVIQPSYSRQLTIPVIFPGKAGKYRLLFSIVNPPIPGNFASPFYNIEIR